MEKCESSSTPRMRQRFNELACRVFRFQYEGNEAYGRFCDRRGKSPAGVSDWREVPAVPVTAFKHADLVVAGLPEGKTFLTSGTTQGGESRGRHRVPDPEIYRAAALAHFERCVLPDGVRPRFAVLAPSLAEQPQSSLCQMIDWLAASFGLASPEYFVVSGELDARSVRAATSHLRAGRRSGAAGRGDLCVRAISRSSGGARPAAFACRTALASSTPEAPRGAVARCRETGFCARSGSGSASPDISSPTNTG